MKSYDMILTSKAVRKVVIEVLEVTPARTLLHLSLVSHLAVATLPVSPYFYPLLVPVRTVYHQYPVLLLKLMAIAPQLLLTIWACVSEAPAERPTEPLVDTNKSS